ncbi:MAG: hypothetical protein DSY82_04005 [Flavobacteriia bacterium]|nr:MAG: hypothetical protein DSY82_04005 [Flavobacteriia bacterium]
MKKLIVVFVFLGFAFQSYAQDLLFESKIKKEKVPVAIVESIQEDFPGYVVEEYSAIPIEYIEEDVIVNRNVKSSDDYDTFLVKIKDKNKIITATYTKEGRLVNTTAYGKNVVLPVSVTKAVVKAFPGWIIVKDYYKMVSYNNNLKKERYKVIIKKGKEKKKVLVDASGNILSVHKVIIP